MVAIAQESASLGVGETPRKGRVTRLQDALATSHDWDIGVPAVDPETINSPSTELSFLEAVNAGLALGSEAYRALDREFRQVQRQLRTNPENQAAEQRLAELRQALVERIEINIRLDYLYAAAVYLELLRQADGAAETVAGFRRQISEKRSQDR